MSKAFPTTLAALGAALALTTPADALLGADALTTSRAKPAASAEKGGKSSGSTAGTGGKREVTKTQTAPCGEGREIRFTAPEELWPPNHKYRDVAIIADGNDDDMVTVEVMGMHDEVVDGEELNGSGNTGDDVSPAAATDMGTGSAETAHQIRGERSGRGDGRTYTFDVLATFDEEDCPAQFTAFVPHDQGKGGSR